MAKTPGVTLRPQPAARPSKSGVGGPKPVVASPPAAAPVEVKPKTSPAQFLREVRAEARKISWTSWKETWITSVMVGIMVVVTALFFLVVDWGLGLFIQQILKLSV